MSHPSTRGQQIAEDVRQWLFTNGLKQSQLTAAILAEVADRCLERLDKTAKTRTRRTPCTPPTPDEVTAYSLEIGYPMDGEGWCDSYTQKGWMVGRNPMKDWRSAVRNWQRNKWTVGAESKKEASATASMGALQMQLKAVEEELNDIWYPGGASFKTPPTGTKLQRSNFLLEQRKRLKERIEAA